MAVMESVVEVVVEAQRKIVATEGPPAPSLNRSIRRRRCADPASLCHASLRHASLSHGTHTARPASLHHAHVASLHRRAHTALTCNSSRTYAKCRKGRQCEECFV